MRVLAAAVLCLLACPAAAGDLGPFEGQADVGLVTPPGTAKFENGHYMLTSAGVNMWYRADGFHFLWKRMSGDVALTADIAFPDASQQPHRKGVLIIRQTLDAGSPYADVAVHGSGLTALQYRREAGADTQDIELNIAIPKTVRIEKRGDHFTMLISQHGEPLHQVGATIKLPIAGPFYVGLGLTSHDPAKTETAVFSNVKLEALSAEPAPAKTVTWSTLQTIMVPDQARVATVILNKRGVFESPNWAPDGKSLLINEDGTFWKVPLLDPPAGGTPVPFDIGDASGCWGEHGFSPDGKWLAISCKTHGVGPDVYIVPAAGGKPRRLTHHPISFFHGWSPDGKSIVYTSIRDGHEDIYTIPAAGGAETRLTTTGVNDGGEFSHDGQWIYFNSDRSGSMQIWRMHPDGAGLEQVTADDHENWYPHISPDGKLMVMLSYAHGTQGHAANQDVTLRIMELDNGLIRNLVQLFGGQGTLDSPTWSPDSSHLAFVSNQILPAK